VVRVQVTRYTSPCLNIRAAFSGGDVSRISQKTHPGWSRVYARVLRGGTIRTGEAVRID
jgi:MOSC domain-containing protein YiiM